MKLMKLAPEWVRTSDPVIRSPARYRWTTAPATCLCQRQEMALKLKSIKNVLDTTNPDIFIKRSDDEIRTTLNAIEKSEIVYKSWKRVKLVTK